MTMKETLMSEAVKDLIQQALDQDFNKANHTFADVMTVKLSDVLDQEQIKLADQVYNGVDPEDEEEIDDDQLELELDDEDIDDTEMEDETVSEPDLDDELGMDDEDGEDDDEGLEWEDDNEEDEGSEES